MEPGMAGSGVRWGTLPYPECPSSSSASGRPTRKGDLIYHANPSLSSQDPWPGCTRLLARLEQLETSWSLQEGVEGAGSSEWKSQSPTLYPPPPLPNAEAVQLLPLTPNSGGKTVGRRPGCLHPHLSPQCVVNSDSYPLT